MAFPVSLINYHYNGINPIVFGYENCKSSHSYGPAVRPYWLIHYVVSGCGTFVTEKNEYKINPGEMFIIRPFEETYYEADDKKPWKYIWIGFTSNENITDNLGDTLFIPEAGKIFEDMKSCDSFLAGKNAYLISKIWELFSVVLRKKEPEREDYIKKALDIIHAEYMKELTVDSISKRLNLERTYFSSLFKRRTGVSPKEYLINYRMNAATSLMRQRNLSVSVIANSVGYSDSFNFSKMFKLHFGMSPSAYIKNDKGSLCE